MHIAKCTWYLGPRVLRGIYLGSYVVSSVLEKRSLVSRSTDHCHELSRSNPYLKCIRRYVPKNIHVRGYNDSAIRNEFPISITLARETFLIAESL